MSSKHPNNFVTIPDSLPHTTESAVVESSSTRSIGAPGRVATVCFRRFSALVCAAGLLILLPVLAACSGEDPGDGVGPEIAVNPLNVSVQTVPEQQGSQAIGPEGGTLNAIGLDGTKFTLEIPKDAIAEDTFVSMIPVASIAGIPLSKGLVGAVQFEPDGLRLSQPALLTVEPTRPIPVSEQVGFAYAGAGQDFHLAPLAPRTDMIQVYVFNFSGAGVGQGSTADIGAAIPASPLARLQQKTAEAIQRDREQGNEMLSGETIKIVEGALGEYQAFLETSLKRAGSDCSLAQQVMAEQIALERQMQLLGVASDDQDAGWLVSASAEKALENCVKEAVEELRKACAEGASQEKIAAAVARLIGYERTRQILGAADETSSPLADVDKILDSCKPRGWSGTITFSENRASSSGGWEGSSRSQATITIEGGTGRWEAKSSGSSTATNLSWDCAKQDAKEYSGQGRAVLNVGGAGAAAGSENTGRPPEGKTVGVSITIDSGGSYRLNFTLPVEGTWHRVATGGAKQCEVYDDTEEVNEWVGAMVEGKGPAQPDRLSGTLTKPIETASGKKVGEQTVTWNLVHR